MNSNWIEFFGIAMISTLVCAFSHAAEVAQPSVDTKLEFEMEHSSAGKKVGSITHTRSIEDLTGAPLVNRFNGLDGRSYMMTIRYVGYAKFEVSKEGKSDQQKPGHVFAVQVLSGKKAMTIETAEKNETKLFVYEQSPQTLYEGEGLTVTIRNQK